LKKWINDYYIFSNLKDFTHYGTFGNADSYHTKDWGLVKEVVYPLEEELKKLTEELKEEKKLEDKEELTEVQKEDYKWKYDNSFAKLGEATWFEGNQTCRMYSSV
jgi:hypothetical protein